MVGLRLRWDRISLLLFTVVGLIVVVVLTVNADGSQAGTAKPKIKTAELKTTSAPKPSGLVPRATPAAAVVPTAVGNAGNTAAAGPVSKAGSSGCPATGAGEAASAVRAAPGRGRTVALTFDDGPSTFTPQVLRILAEKRVPATFFMIGSQAAANPAEVKAVAAQGHLIGNHSWSHRAPSPSAGWSTGTLTTEISRTNEALKRETGSGTCWFRPPEGIVRGTEPFAGGHGLRVALWSVDTEDWKVERGADRNHDAVLSRKIALNAVAGAEQDHPVILMHDGGGYRGATVAALGSVIDFYRANGYTFVRLDGR